MDSTAGDLSHAAKELDQNIEKASLRSSIDEEYLSSGVLGEKQEGHRHASSSSSEDVVVEKLDSRIVKVRDVKEGDEAYAHLPEHERDIVRRQLEIPPVTVTFRTLYRYATRNDLIIIAISALCAIVGGAVMPLMTVCDCYNLWLQLSLLILSIGHLWPISGHFSGLFQQHSGPLEVYFRIVTLHFILCLLSYCRIHHHIRLHGRLHLLWRAHNAKDSGTVPRRDPAPKHCFL